MRLEPSPSFNRRWSWRISGFPEARFGVCSGSAGWLEPRRCGLLDVVVTENTGDPEREAGLRH